MPSVLPPLVVEAVLATNWKGCGLWERDRDTATTAEEYGFEVREEVREEDDNWLATIDLGRCGGGSIRGGEGGGTSSTLVSKGLAGDGADEYGVPRRNSDNAD